MTAGGDAQQPKTVQNAVEALRAVGARNVRISTWEARSWRPASWTSSFPARFYPYSEGWAAEVPDVGETVYGRDREEARTHARELVTRRMRERPDLVRSHGAAGRADCVGRAKRRNPGFHGVSGWLRRLDSNQGVAVPKTVRGSL